MGVLDLVRVFWGSDNCSATQHASVVAVEGTMATHALRYGNNRYVTFSLLVESSGPHTVCYLGRRRPLVRVTRTAMLHLNAWVNSSFLHPTKLLASTPTHVDFIGRGLNPYLDRVAMTLGDYATCDAVAPSGVRTTARSRDPFVT